MAQTAKDLNGLKVGEKAPFFTAKDQNGKEFSLETELQKGAVVIIFYRGQWCPICNKHLSNLQDSLELIYEKGATVIAISPEKSEFLLKTQKKTKAEFTLLYDEDYKIAKAFDVIFNPTKMQLFMYNKLLRADLKNAQTDDSEQLPIPATFVINKEGIIIWRHFDPNYKKRSSVNAILDALN
ncbi:MAG: AhpC/TSA family protein [Flavobacteriales bacterium]|nr:AhpC/TSA family protein [Flavobacteriales bacterium]